MIVFDKCEMPGTDWIKVSVCKYIKPSIISNFNWNSRKGMNHVSWKHENGLFKSKRKLQERNTEFNLMLKR